MSYKLFLLGLLSAVTIVTTVIFLIKKQKLSEEYSSIWIVVSGFIFVSTLFSQHILATYAWIKGDEGSGPEILLFFSLVFIVFFLIFVSVKLSKYKRNIVALTQEVGLLKEKLESLNHPSKKA
jgi:hypothetical protein